MSEELERRLRAAAETYPKPDEAETTRARHAFLAASGPARPVQRRQRVLTPRLALVAFAFLAAVGGAFAAGLSLGSSDGALVRDSAAGPGFLPAIGWNVLQTGLTAPPQAPVAMAANVPFAAEDRGLDRPPAATINTLGPTGVVFYAIFIPAEPALAEGVPIRQLPLRLADARPGGLEGLPSTGRMLRLHAVTGGFIVDVVIAFGVEDPPAAVIAAAAEQLQRLVVPGCPRDTLAVAGDDRAGAEEFVVGWLGAHYIGRPSDLEGATAKAFVIGSDPAPHAAAAEAVCGDQVRGRMLEVQVTLPTAAHATAGPRPLNYLVVKTADGFLIWQPV